MHPETARLLAREHQKAFLREADAHRLAATSSGRERTPRASDRSAPAWRRVIGWAAIDLGVWLAGGWIDAAPDLR